MGTGGGGRKNQYTGMFRCLRLLKGELVAAWAPDAHREGGPASSWGTRSAARRGSAACRRSAGRLSRGGGGSGSERGAGRQDLVRLLRRHMAAAVLELLAAGSKGAERGRQARRSEASSGSSSSRHSTAPGAHVTKPSLDCRTSRQPPLTSSSGTAPPGGTASWCSSPCPPSS